jgi:hypothetical protein
MNRRALEAEDPAHLTCSIFHIDKVIPISSKYASLGRGGAARVFCRSVAVLAEWS